MDWTKPCRFWKQYLTGSFYLYHSFSVIIAQSLSFALAPQRIRRNGERIKKLTAAQKRGKKKPKRKGKKSICGFLGMDMDEFIQENADPIWLHQNEMWEYIQPEENEDIY